MDPENPKWLEEYGKVYSQPAGTPNFDFITPRCSEFLADLQSERLRLQSLVNALESLASALPLTLETVSSPRVGLVGWILGPKIIRRCKYRHVKDHLDRARQALLQVTEARDHFVGLADGSRPFTTLSNARIPDSLLLKTESAFLEGKINDSYLLRVKDGRHLICKRCNQSLLRDVGIKVYDHIYCYTCAKDLFRRGGLKQRDMQRLSLGNPEPIWLVYREDDTLAVTRSDVLQRDHFTCRDCGKKRTNQALEVHHVLPRNHSGDNRMTNLVTLCTYCHDREAWFRHFRKDPSTLGERIKDYNHRTASADSGQTSLEL